MKKGYKFVLRALRLVIYMLCCSLLLGRSSLEPADQTEQVRAFTRQIEFDYGVWTLDALGVKLGEEALNTSNYLSTGLRRQTVLDYLELVRRIQTLETRIALIYADPAIRDQEGKAAPLQKELDQLHSDQVKIAPTAEAILEKQINEAADLLGLTLAGQAVPPVLFHATPLPLALIVSPRETIRQDENISLIADLTIEQRAALEMQVDQALSVSSLVVNIGGVGVYPTMVAQTSSLSWLSEVIAHEWVHNYLTLRPLGLNYMTSPELRVMNETTASIAGKEIGRLVLERNFPELLPPVVSPQPPASANPSEPPAFDFRKEMNITRKQVDLLLSEGKIGEAESYMEARRKVFWENGYGIRKLNQAYFAFHGAYADEPGGATGGSEDPVGAAVRELRRQSASLAEFLNRIAWATSFEQLQRMISQPALPAE